MSKTNETTVDLSNRKRVGPEEESREDQFDGNELDALHEEASDPATEEAAAADRHGIDQSNDLTTP
jgi:hypothetical protein